MSGTDGTCQYPDFESAPAKNAVRLRRSVCVFCADPIQRGSRLAQLQAAAGLSFEPNTLRRH
jgi:hypothetical protein